MDADGQPRAQGRQDLPDPLLRLAAAPISWGVCEVPGWGWQLPADTVLRQMREVGLAATEFGPEGFLPAVPGERAAVLRRHELRAVGGFVPLVLHDRAQDPLSAFERLLDEFVVAGADTVVLAAASGRTDYDTRPVLDPAGWATLLRNLARADQAARERRLRLTLHPHVGTMVEGPADVDRVLDGSGVALCLDTGHLLIGGTDPVALAARHTGRIGHVHLKDVDGAQAARVRSGEVGYGEAVRRGLYRPLGQGDVDVAAIVATLETAGYAGWYVLEQDTVLDGPAGGEEPLADVRASLEHLRAVLAAVPTQPRAAGLVRGG